MLNSNLEGGRDNILLTLQLKEKFKKILTRLKADPELITIRRVFSPIGQCLDANEKELLTNDQHLLIDETDAFDLRSCLQFLDTSGISKCIWVATTSRSKKQDFPESFKTVQLEKTFRSQPNVAHYYQRIKTKKELQPGQGKVITLLTKDGLEIEALADACLLVKHKVSNRLWIIVEHWKYDCKKVAEALKSSQDIKESYPGGVYSFLADKTTDDEEDLSHTLDFAANGKSIIVTEDAYVDGFEAEAIVVLDTTRYPRYVPYQPLSRATTTLVHVCLIEQFGGFFNAQCLFVKCKSDQAPMELTEEECARLRQVSHEAGKQSERECNWLQTLNCFLGKKSQSTLI